MANMLYEAGDIDKAKSIEFEQMGQALLKLAEGRKFWETCLGFFLPSDYKPWLQVWYCSDRSHADIANAERKEKRRLKRLEKLRENKSTDDELERSDDLNVD